MSTPPPGLLVGAGPGQTLSPLEQEVLDEYARLLENMNRGREQLSNSIADIAGTPAARILDSLRDLERKTGLVFTLLKASVYSMVLQQQMDVENRDADDEDIDMGDVGYD